MNSTEHKEHPATTQKMTRGQSVGLLALCLLGASGWLIETIWPAASASSMLPASAWRVLHEVFLAAVLFVADRGHLSRSQVRFGSWLKLVLGSVLLLGLPEALAAINLPGGSAVGLTALLAFVPVVVVVIVSEAEADRSNGMLAFALVGVAGALLLLPFPVPESWRAVGGLGIILAVVVLVAFASVWLHGLLSEFRLLDAAIVFCIANAAFSLATFLLSGGAGGSWEGFGRALVVEALKAVCFDLPQLILLLWLMREVAPIRFAARFLIVPLLTVAEGFLLIRPEITFRSVSGSVLLLFSTWHLLTGKLREEEPRLVLH